MLCLFFSSSVFLSSKLSSSWKMRRGACHRQRGGGVAWKRVRSGRGGPCWPWRKSTENPSIPPDAYPSTADLSLCAYHPEREGMREWEKENFKLSVTITAVYNRKIERWTKMMKCVVQERLDENEDWNHDKTWVKWMDLSMPWHTPIDECGVRGII